MNLIIWLNTYMTLMFIVMMHPLSLGSVLLIQTITIALITGTLNSNFWFSYILFLILIGGMMILFMYMTSIASNEPFKMNKTAPLMLIVTAPSLLTNQYISQISNYMTHSFNLNNNLYFSLNKMINMPMNSVLTILIIYLLITLIASVKISKFSKGPLRQMN